MAAAVASGRSLSVPNDMQSVNDILRSLEEGSTMTAFYKARKPESSLVRVKLETREVIGARIRGLYRLSLGCSAAEAGNCTTKHRTGPTKVQIQITEVHF